MTQQVSGSDPFLELRGISKRFGKFTALSGVDLDVREGELLTFLGPSGCGKSTLLRIIAGLDRQSEGTLRQAGTDIAGRTAAQRGFGILFQSYALFPNLTVADNVGYGLKRRGGETASRIAQLLDLVSLPGIQTKYPSELSGGQQQRVALARALAPSPKLLLLDEPLSALDAKVRIHLRRQIRELQRKLGITTIMVTHDQEEALSMADRIVVMNHGTVEQVGTPAEIYDEPNSLFVADFVGRMNFMPGRSDPAGAFAIDGCRSPFTLAARPVREGKGTLCIRPEDIVLGAVGDGRSGNGGTATIEGLEFLGAYYRADLVVPQWGDIKLVADIPVQSMRDLDVRIGSSLAITLVPSRLRSFAGTGHA